MSTQRTKNDLLNYQHHHGNNNMNEPLLLLRSSVNIRSQQQHPPPPQHAFQIRQQYNNADYNNNNVHHHDHHHHQQSVNVTMMSNNNPTFETANENYEYIDENDDDDDDLYQQENELHLQALRMWGRPYYCACLDFVMACILGLVMGGCGLGFLTATHWLRLQWKTRITSCIASAATTTTTTTTTTTITSFIISSFTTTTILEEQQQQNTASAAATATSSSSSCQDSLWIILIITTMGGFLTAMTFCIFHPRTGTTTTAQQQELLLVSSPPLPLMLTSMSIPVRTMFHDLNFPHPAGEQRPPALAAAATTTCAVVVLASFWTLVSGAPLGPEQALGSMATMAAWFRPKLLGATTTTTSSTSSRSHEQHEQQQQQLEWIRICTAAIVGGLCGNPLLGPIFVQELSNSIVVQIPPSTTTSESLIRDESLEARRPRRRQQQQQQYSNASVSNNNSISPPVLLGQRNNSGSQSPRQQQQQQQQERQQHSAQPPYMQGWVLQLVASLFAGLWMQVWFPEWLPYHALAPLPQQQQQQDDDSGHGGTISPVWMLYWNTTGRNLVMAIPIGLICGLLGTIAICIMTTSRWIRHATCRLVLQKMMTSTTTTTTTTSCCANMMRIFLLVLFPTLAGLIHGCLTLYLVSPLNINGGGGGSTMMTMDGLSFIQSTWNQVADAAAAAANVTRMTDNHSDGNEHHDNDVSTSTFLYSRQTLVILTLVQIVGMAISLGWGLVGGSILTMLVAGLCMGLALVNDAHDDKHDDDNNFLHLPSSLTVPCCMAAMVVSICPIPLSMTLGMCSIFRFHASNNDGNDSVTIMGPVMVACLTAWTVTGGTGFLYRYEKAQIESERTSLSERAGGGEEEEERIGLDHFSIGRSGYHDANGDDDDDNDDEHTGAGLTSDASSDDELLRNVRSAIFGRI